MLLPHKEDAVHKAWLYRLLAGIYDNQILANSLYFKGGTCAYLFYNLPRLSLDLDFDILEHWSTEDLENLKTVIEKCCKVKDFYEKRFTIFFLLDYQLGAPNIKLELNKRVWQNNHYQDIWFLGVKMKIVDQETLLTNKIVALTDRKQTVSRDLFDVYYFLKMGFNLNPLLIEERTGKSIQEYLKLLPGFIEKHYTAKNILQGLGEVLDNEQKQWVKNDLIKEVIDEIQKIKI